MKKIYLAFAVCFGAMVSQAQTKVVLKVDDSANKNKTGIKFKGAYDSWNEVSGYDDGTNGDAVSGDNIWSLEITANDGTYEWGAVDQANAWLTSGVPNYTFTVSGTTITGKTEIVIPKFNPMHPVTFTINDLSKKETSLKLKGSMFGWNTMDLYDDGTNGDATAGDNIWSLKTDVEEGSWEWGFENACGWKLVGSNKKFTVAAGGAVTGDITYSIPALTGTPIKVTFKVDMSNEIVNVNGLYVSGDFLDRISTMAICNWTKDTLMLTDANKDDVYEITVSMYAGAHKWKFYNGRGGDPDGESFDFKTAGCGSDNGLGGWNRDLDFTGRTTDTILPTFTYNSCASKSTGSVKGLNKNAYSVYPNPAQGTTTVRFANASQAHTVSLLDLNGRIITNETTTNGTSEIVLNNISKGIYLIQIKDAEGRTAFSKLISE